MPKTQDVAPAWLTLSTTTRLFLPIFLLMLVVGTVRYRLMVKVETRSAEAHFAQEVQLIKKYLVPAIAGAMGTDSAEPLATLLHTEAQCDPDIDMLQWRSGAQMLEARNLQPAQAQYPTWFVTWLHIAPHIAHLDVPRSLYQRSPKIQLRLLSIETGQTRHQGRRDDKHGASELVRVPDQQARLIRIRRGSEI